MCVYDCVCASSTRSEQHLHYCSLLRPSHTNHTVADERCYTTVTGATDETFSKITDWMDSFINTYNVLMAQKQQKAS